MTGQANFSKALLNPDLPPPTGLTSPASRNDPLRFAVYRNNIHVSLVAALGKAFPVVKSLVGAQFFDAMARVYVGREKPDSPLLSRYGEGFPGFLSSFAPVASLPYLPDIAMLEATWRRAYHAQDRAAMTLAFLATVPPETLATLSLTPHPATALVSSLHPIGSIWGAHQSPSNGAMTARGPETVLVTRPALAVEVLILPPGDVDFATALLQGQAVGEAAISSATVQGFDPGRALVGLVGCGAFAAPDPEGHNEDP